MNRTVVETLASAIQARLNCIKRDNAEWKEKHEEKIREIEKEHLPRGAGIDSGCSVCLDCSTADKIVIDVPFHHMNDVGMYIGWITYAVTVRPSFIGGMDLHVEACDTFELSDEEDEDEAAYFECLTESTVDYLADVFSDCLDEPMTCEVDILCGALDEKKEG